MQAREPSSGGRKQGILRQALKRKTPQGRAAFLDGACGADVALRVEMDALLASHEGGECGAWPLLQQPSPCWRLVGAPTPHRNHNGTSPEPRESSSHAAGAAH